MTQKRIMEDVRDMYIKAARQVLNVSMLNWKDALLVLRAANRLERKIHGSQDERENHHE